MTLFSKTKRIVAIGDIHGDWKALITALKVSNLVDSQLNWKGGQTHLVQVGDVLDRGGRSTTWGDEQSEWKILKLLFTLQDQAKEAGGRVHILLGNHELMNVQGDFRYTSPLSINDFRGKRYQMLKPQGQIAQQLADRAKAVVKIGGWLFSHAGLRFPLANKYQLREINQLVKDYLQGKHPQNIDLISDIFWNRNYGQERPDCRDLYQVNKKLRIRGQVVGHTVQTEINSRCQSKLWRIDTGMSQAFGQEANYQVLEILNNGKKINILG